MENGTKQFLNPQEVERATTMGPAKTVAHTTTVSEAGKGVTKTVTTVTTASGTKTTTTTTTSGS
jgi:hypothetical protein